MVFFCVIIGNVMKGRCLILSIFDKIANTFRSTNDIVGDGKGNYYDINEYCKRTVDLSYKRLAIEIAVDLIGNAVARVDWKEFKNNKEQNGLVSSLLNSEPNKQETSSLFFKKLTRKLLLDQEVLIVPHKGFLYIADDFTREFVSFDKVAYHTICINGMKAPNRVYYDKDVIYMNYGNEMLRRFLDAYMAQYTDLVSASEAGFKGNKTRRFVLSSDQYRAQLTDVQKEFNEMMEQQLTQFMNADGKASLYAKPKNVELEDMSDKNYMLATDTRNLVRDIFEMAANAFHIPPEYMLGGQVTQIVVDNFLVNSVYPIVDMFKEAFNNYQYPELTRRKGTGIRPDTTKSRIVDLKTIGTFIAQVFPTGALTLNDIVTKYLQLDSLPEDIADTRVITKNYSELGSFISGDVDNQVEGEDYPPAPKVEYEDEEEGK